LKTHYPQDERRCVARMRDYPNSGAWNRAHRRGVQGVRGVDVERGVCRANGAPLVADAPQQQDLSRWRFRQQFKKSPASRHPFQVGVTAARRRPTSLQGLGFRFRFRVYCCYSLSLSHCSGIRTRALAAASSSHLHGPFRLHRRTHGRQKTGRRRRWRGGAEAP
jgi:hypothetical protein